MSSIFIAKNWAGFALYSNRCIIIEKLIFYEDVFINMIDTQIAFFYSSLNYLNHTSDKKNEWTDLI
ncbi:MAG: hypothetical protein CVU51_09300 [Deltaproteobacteria bacterium HGW-Deltaproteobacteria-1]|nr:MAG: hypothetical protein CVU51_09300 [Deltaproteobacteria bacterium HGW-Deltaproteobacteria-1]